MFSFLATLNIRLISIVLAVLLTFSAGWTTNGWRLNKRYESEKLAQAQANRKTEIEHQKAVDLLTISYLLLLASCTSAPPAQTTYPTMDKLPNSQLDSSFMQKMQNFLSGKLPEPTQSALPYNPATHNMTK